MFGRSHNPEPKFPGSLGTSPETTPPRPPVPAGFVPAPGSRPVSIIGSDLSIVGQKITLVCKSTLMVIGEVYGDINGSEVTVGDTGKVIGTITARSITVHGKVQGRTAGRTVTLHPTAHIDGDIIQKNLVIAEGAKFDGQRARRQGRERDRAAARRWQRLPHRGRLTGANEAVDRVRKFAGYSGRRLVEAGDALEQPRPCATALRPSSSLGLGGAASAAGLPPIPARRRFRLLSPPCRRRAPSESRSRAADCLSFCASSLALPARTSRATRGSLIRSTSGRLAGSAAARTAARRPSPARVPPKRRISSMK